MANIQEDVTRDTWELMLRFLGTGMELVYQISHEGNALLRTGSDFSREFLIALINKQKQLNDPTDATSAMLHRQKKGEVIHTMAIADEDVKEVCKCLADKNILFTSVSDPHDDITILMYMSADSDKVSEIISLWQADRGLVSEVNPDMFLQYYAAGGIGTITGLDKADLQMFRQFAKNNRFVFSSTPTEEPGKYMIIYNPKDKELVRKTMDATVWAFSGTLGDDIKDRKFDLIKNLDSVLSNFFIPGREFYVANSKNPEHFLQVTGDELIYCKYGNEVTRVSRNSEDFLEKAMQYIDSMEIPILFNREEFELINLHGERDKEAIAAAVQKKAERLPDLDKLQADQDAHNEKMERIIDKMALDDENTAGFWIYDNDIDFAEGGTYEMREDLDDQTKADVMAARRNAKKFHINEVMEHDERSVDFLIAEAEKLRTSPIPTKNRQRDLDR